jgi:hypothetical protein
MLTGSETILTICLNHIRVYYNPLSLKNDNLFNHIRMTLNSWVHIGKKREFAGNLVVEPFSVE